MTRRTLLLALLVLAAVSCGKRGDPRPPVPVIPQATSDLVVTQRANRVILSWSYPSMTTAGKSLTDIRSIAVHRLVEELPVFPGGRDPRTLQPGEVELTEPQPVVLFSKIPTVAQAEFAKLSNRVLSIEKANLADATTGSRLVLTDTPPFRSSDGRPVRVTYAVVTDGGTRESDFSNLAVIVPLPVAAAPQELAATTSAGGVTLTWKAPERTVTGEEGPVIAGYHVYRDTPGATPGELDSPINSAPLKATSYTDTPGYGEHEYRVVAVAHAGPPPVQSDFSAPLKVEFRDLIPPAAPATVTALLETRVVRLLWDPVEATDLAGYNVYRTEGTARLKLSPNPVKDPNFLDISIQIGIAYFYEITAIDTSGNESAPTRTETVIVPKTP